jgi:hypothetical protein
MGTRPGTRPKSNSEAAPGPGAAAPGTRRLDGPARKQNRPRRCRAWDSETDTAGPAIAQYSAGGAGYRGINPAQKLADR